MPCNTIQTAKVEIGKVDKTLLDLAMKELGYRYQYKNGMLTLSGVSQTDEIVKEVKRAYSKQVVFGQAKKFGWQMKAVGENQWEVIRR